MAGILGLGVGAVLARDISAPGLTLSDAQANRKPELTELVLPRALRLNTLAQQRFPSDRSRRDEFRRRVIDANPEIDWQAPNPGTTLLPSATRLRIPGEAAGDSLLKVAANAELPTAANAVVPIATAEPQAAVTATQGNTLKNVIIHALKTNPEVRGAVANRDATEQELEAAKAPQRPTLDLRLAGGREHSNTTTTPSGGISLQRGEASLIARQTLFDGGAASGDIARQTARLQSLDSKVFDVSDSVGQRIADVYIEVVKTEELYRLAKQNVDIHRSYLEKLRDRDKSGVGQRADLKLAEGREALANSTLTSREAARDDARVRFRRLVGEKPRDLVVPDSVSRTIPALIELAEEVAYANNASLKVARADVLAARESASVARTKLSPTLSLEAGATRNRNMDGTVGKNNDQTLMLVMNYNLYRGGSDEARIREAEARLTSAMETKNNVLRIIEEEIGRAWVALNAAKASLDHLNEHMARSVEVKDAYQAQFDIGKRSMLDLMNSESELFQARSNLTSGQYAVTQSEYRLLAAMGGLLKILGVEVEKLDSGK